MKTQEIKEVIKAEIRVYMRMLRDMKRAMREKITPNQLRKIATYYSVPEVVVDRLVKREIIIGLRIGREFEKNEIYKGQSIQEHKAYNFSFTCNLSYKLADALRMYSIYDRHIDMYKKQMQGSVLSEIEKEDELIRPHLSFCNQLSCEGAEQCTSIHCDAEEGGHRPNEKMLKEMMQKKLTWCAKVRQWLHSLGGRVNPKDS